MAETISGEEWLSDAISVPPGGTLFINADRGQIEVSAHAANEVRVQARARGWRAGLVLFSLEKSGPDVHFDVSIDTFLPLFGAARILARIWVPKEYSIDIESGGGNVNIEDISGRVDAQSRGGSMTVARIGGPVTLRTSGGSVSVEQIDGDVRARTSGGSVRIDDVCGDVAGRTSGGTIRAYDVDGQVDLHTSGGSIKVSFVEEPCGRCETSGGSVEVRFPDGVGVDLDARTSGGSVRLEHEADEPGKTRRNRFLGRVNGGGPPLKLRTSGGSIRVLRA